MSDYLQAASHLDTECRVFCQYLIDQPPNDYVLRKYRDGNRCIGKDGSPSSTRFDRLLLRLATMRPWLTRLVDGYARFFAPGSLLRKKLTLLLAILESNGVSYRYFDLVDPFGRPGFYTRLVLKGVWFVGTLTFVSIFLLPMQILLKSDSRERRSEGRDE